MMVMVLLLLLLLLGAAAALHHVPPKKGFGTSAGTTSITYVPSCPKLRACA
jgi:hypothetical protein